MHKAQPWNKKTLEKKKNKVKWENCCPVHQDQLYSYCGAITRHKEKAVLCRRGSDNVEGRGIIWNGGGGA